MKTGWGLDCLLENTCSSHGEYFYAIGIEGVLVVGVVCLCGIWL